MKKRLVALIMVMALALSLVPVGAVDLDFQNQIDSNGNEITTDDQKVKHSKTITQTGENTFDITLTVKTVEEIEKQTVSEDAAVVLVLDMSNSMTEEDMQAAREAAKNFVNQLVEGASSTAQRQVAIVEFGSNAKTAVPWANANDSSQKAQILSGIDSVENGFSYDVYCSETGKHTHEERVWVDNAEVEQGFLGRWYCTTCGKAFKNPARTGHWCTQNVEYEGSHVTKTERDGGGTNIEGGLLLANNLLGASSVSGISNKYVVLMTDGVPTYHVDDSDETGNTSFIEGSRGGGDEADHEDYHDISCVSGWDTGDNLPQQIKNQGAKLYTVSYKNSNQTVAGKTIDKWLASFSTQTITAEDDIFGSLEKIAEIIVNQAKAWILTDPMGDYINFGENPSITRVTNANEADSDAVRKFNTDTKTLIWDLKNDVTPSKEGDWNVYTLNYSITLDNLVENFQAKKPYSTNGKTELTYMVTKDGVLQPDLETTELQVPTVHGLASDLTFTKKGSDDKTLENVTFTLTTEDKPGWSMTEESNQDGTVSFTNIPSGHTYTLTETSTPPGYNPAEDITVTVTKGNVATSMDQDGNSLNEGVLINQAKTGTLTVTKTVNGLEGGVDGLPDNFAIEVKNSTGEVVQTLTTDSAGSDTTYTWTVNDLAPDTYTVTESNYAVDGYSVTATGDTTATVTAGQTATATANLTNTYTKQVPGLEVTKTLDKVNGADYDSGMVKVDDVLTYTITVKNTGNTTLTNIDVSDTLTIAGTTSELSLYGNEDCTGDAVTSIASMDPDTSQTLYAKYTVLATDAGQEIINSATAEVPDGPNDTPDDPPKVTVENPALSVTKEVDKGSVKVGDTITYTITVTNTGNVDLTNVEIMDTFDGSGTLDTSNLPEGVTYEDGKFTIATLAKEAEETITVTYVAQEADVDETITNSATSALDSNKEDDTAETTVTEADNPAISITKTASVKGLELKEGDTVDVGDTITYTLQVKNTGNTSFDTVTVTDTMWTSGKVTQITQKIGDTEYLTNLPENGIWTIVPRVTDDPTFDPGETWTCTYTYTVQDGDTTIENTATVSTTDGGPDGSDTITIPVTGYDLSIEKVLTSVNGEPYQEGSKVRPGDVLTYTINVTNNNEETVTSFTVSDNLWQENQVETITIGAATADVTGGSYLFQGTLYQGDTWTCTYDYTVPEDVASVSNTAVIDLPGDNDPGDNVTVEVEPDAPGLKVEKSLSQVNGGDYTGGKVSVGDKLTYTIQVTNTGNTTLSGVTVEDSLWNYEDAIQVDGELAYVADGGTYTIKYEIAPDDMVTITYTYIVLRSDAGDTLTNTATVTTDGGTTGEDTTETPVKPVTPIRPPVDPDKPELNTEDHYAYIVGYPDGNVKPEGNITRAEVATIFFRLLTDESRNEFWSQTNDYTDVPADAWYNNAVSTLSNAGIIDGYEDGTFKPDGNITRAEFATIAVRFFEATYDGEDLFSDIAGHWAQDYINEAANAGIVDGYPDGTFRPQQYITRAEAMTMVNRTIDRHPDADHLLDDMIVWPDNPETAWYYEQVQEATNSHEYTMNTDDEQNPYEIWTELLPNRDWSELEKEWSDANDGAGSGEVV